MQKSVGIFCLPSDPHSPRLDYESAGRAEKGMKGGGERGMEERG